MNGEKRDITVTLRLTQGEKKDLEYCAGKLGMTQTEILVKGLGIIKGIIDRRMSGKG